MDPTPNDHNDGSSALAYGRAVFQSKEATSPLQRVMTQSYVADHVCGGFSVLRLLGPPPTGSSHCSDMDAAPWCSPLSRQTSPEKHIVTSHRRKFRKSPREADALALRPVLYVEGVTSSNLVGGTSIFKGLAFSLPHFHLCFDDPMALCDKACARSTSCRRVPAGTDIRKNPCRRSGL